MRKRQRTLSITHKFGNRAWNLKRCSRFVILSGVFEAKDLTRPDKANPNESRGRKVPACIQPPEKGSRLLRESPGVIVRFAAYCEVLHSADSVQDDKLLSAGFLLNTRAVKMWVMEKRTARTPRRSRDSFAASAKCVQTTHPENRACRLPSFQSLPSLRLRAVFRVARPALAGRHHLAVHRARN